ncbi:hypothetical protein RQP46_006577 [Phenoliferia psychrophenolica]
METSQSEAPTQPGFPPPTLIPPSPTPAGSPGDLVVNQDALAVRQNLARRVLLSIRDIGSARRRNLLFISVFSLSQIIAFIVILALTSHSTCDKPLRTCLILTIVRLALSLPLNTYASLSPSASRRISADRRAELEAERRFGTTVIDRRVRQLSDVALGLSICVFLLLNFYVISSKTCHSTAPALYYTSVVALVFSYLFAAEIILLLLAIVFFLPLALIGIRWFGWGEKSPEIAGPAAAAATTTAETRALPAGVEGIRLNESQSSCAICLNDYEPPPPPSEPWEPETLRLLPCGHVFHNPQGLPDPNAFAPQCPICQQPVLPRKGKGTGSAV